ncbi:hypothetical protein EIP86_009093 [Pleurotus ostreatoroseus]|nr:hypothetical protein EIP86_009093 [Pleurotus ostreatoroseus]
MFSRVSTLPVLALALLAVATPNPVERRNNQPTATVTVTAPGPTVTDAGSCNTGPIQCCNIVTSADSKEATSLLGLLGIVLSDVTALVGIQCSPITVIGVGGGACSAHPVCCENNSVGGLISIGCIPIFL